MWKNPMFLLLSLPQFFLDSLWLSPQCGAHAQPARSWVVERHPRHTDSPWLLSTQDRVPDPDKKKQYKNTGKRRQVL